VEETRPDDDEGPEPGGIGVLAEVVLGLGIQFGDSRHVRHHFEGDPPPKLQQEKVWRLETTGMRFNRPLARLLHDR
jgi:hypothetical protein